MDDGLRQTVCDAIEGVASDLRNISQDIWCHPELAFQESHAHIVLADYLSSQDFTVERSYKLDTAFRATAGDSTGPHIALLSEYDALPEIGHACGHNLIAIVGAAAGVGVKAAIESLGEPMIGKVSVIGCPAEEGGGGKVSLIGAGAFKDVDAALMAHPSSSYNPDPIYMAINRFTVTYHGKAAHAAAFPWQGVNALDAAVLCYQSIACLRQQLKPTWRVHAIITNGGIKPNIIPETAAMEINVRAITDAELKILTKKVVTCCETAATTTGCTAEIKMSPNSYSGLVNNKLMVDVFHKHSASVAVDKKSQDIPVHKFAGGSTDMGNVSRVVPGIHPNFYIGTTNVIHTRAFREDAGDVRAHPYAIATAKALALTAVELMLDPDLLKQVKSTFKADMQKY